MCLGIPAKVIHKDESNVGKVDYLGTKVKTNFSLIEDVQIGDWVIIHAGFAIQKYDPADALETLKIWEELKSA